MTLDKSKSMVTPPDEVKRLKGVNYFQPRPQPWFLEGTPGIYSGEDVRLVPVNQNDIVRLVFVVLPEA